MPRIDELPRSIQNLLGASRHCIHGDVGFLRLTQGYVALVDASAVPLLCRWAWYAHASNLYKPCRRNATPKIYAARTDAKNRRVYLHRFITGAERGVLVMHLNEYGLDCRLENLRLGTHAENMEAREGIEVVTW